MGVPNGRRLLEKWERNEFIIRIAEYEELEARININNEKFKDLMYIYGLALKEVEKKIDIIRYDYEYFNKYDSIDHVMTRIKSPESILNKLNISMVKVEIQIRSLAMDFWASLEHKIKYKPNGEINEDVSKELVKCARDINKLDNKMIKLFKK